MSAKIGQEQVMDPKNDNEAGDIIIDNLNTTLR
jgi:hypothetical protein